MQEPLLGGLVFVNVEIVEHHVQVANGIGSDDVVHETQEVHRRPSVSNMRDHRAGRDLQGGQERLRAVTDVFVGPGAGFLGAQRQQGLGPIQRLNARFLVYTEHERILGRVEIGPDSVQ